MILLESNGNIVELRKATEIHALQYFLKDSVYIAKAMSMVSAEQFETYHEIYDLFVDYYKNYSGILSDDIAQTYLATKKINGKIYILYQNITKAYATDEREYNESEFEAILNQVTDFYKRKVYLNIAEEIVNKGVYNTPDKSIEEVEKFVNDSLLKLKASNSEVRSAASFVDDIHDIKDAYIKLRDNPDSITYIPTGFDIIDDKEGGFRPSELVYIIGRKGDGKSVLMLNLAHNAWAAGHNVMVFTLEIPKEDYERRFISRGAEISSNGLKRGTLDECDSARFKKFLVSTKEGKTPDGKQTGDIFFVDVPSRCTPSFIESQIELTEKIKGIKYDVIIVDYAGIMQNDTFIAEKRHQQGQIALDLKRIARKHGCVVISAAQMSRQGKNDTSNNGHADTSHVAESDQVADHIDWGIAIRSTDEKYGIIESFKTRDAAPFRFSFAKNYGHMMINPIADNNAWGTAADEHESPFDSNK
jgi:replicative DNA helicase